MAQPSAILSTSRGCLGNVGHVAINPSHALVHNSHGVSGSRPAACNIVRTKANPLASL
ncbi:hypothetical protein SynPROSU1_00715 [Synechococcus sp. PROS-U-1]|nr:hypothetical protein SynPROSU1_00715 [Synechococcus sp. PROS-U-1]